MTDLREQLEQCFQGRVCLMGLGNTDYGDDGFGVRLAETLAVNSRITHHASRIIIAGKSLERHLMELTGGGFDHLIFLDAVEFGGAPGAVVFLDSMQMAARFPQISTHKISLGMLAKRAEADSSMRVWLLGVQPESLKSAPHLTPTVQRTLEILADVLSEAARCASADSALRTPHSALVC